MLYLVEPTLLIDKQKCIRNIEMMVEKAKRNNLTLRPHFKTHQSHEVGRWFRNAGVSKITVSSVKMAEYFAQDGWKDITVAFPINVHEKERLNKLAGSITLNLLAVSSENIDWLATEVKHPINIFIEVDSGYHRTGVAPADFKTIDSILQAIQKHQHFHFVGFLCHAGHSYKARSKKEIMAVHQECLDAMALLHQKYQSIYPNMVLSPGDTPTCSVAENFPGVNEMRPGNFVFYDIMQHEIGSCSFDQVAVAMACPVVAVYPERNEVVVHGGGVHFSKDVLKLADNTLTFGKVVTLSNHGWSIQDNGMYLKALSQEHGTIHVETEKAKQIKIGDFLGILPVHSCMTADVMNSYLTLEGERISCMEK